MIGWFQKPVPEGGVCAPRGRAPSMLYDYDFDDYLTLTLTPGRFAMQHDGSELGEGSEN